ncbi:hypothetical protein Ahy_B10g102856 isoform F [Arachis hypogaea]|nr:hypothetical protein Ahy_B10g102856 isoform F [Arachis hypogaea]
MLQLNSALINAFMTELEPDSPVIQVITMIFLRVDLPPWFSVLSIVLNSNVDLDVSRIETAPQSMLPIICFRDGSPPLPDALSMANSAISEKNPYDIDKQITIGFCSCDRNHGGFDCSIEIVLLGDMGAGKTSLVLRFVKVQFSEYQESTIGAAFFTQVLSLNEATVKFDIWDTTGQERYHSLAPMYYRGADAAIVVYDITSMESFARAKKWVQQVQRHANPSLIMFLVANKADLGAERKVANEDGEEYAKENGLSFLETSAKTAQNVNKLFYEIVWRKEIGKSKPFTPNWNQAASHTSRNQKKQLVLLCLCREMGLWTLLEGFLLLANALAITNEDRFLAPRGWGFSDISVGRTKSLKGQIIGLIHASPYMRVPLSTSQHHLHYCKVSVRKMMMISKLRCQCFVRV